MGDALPTHSHQHAARRAARSLRRGIRTARLLAACLLVAAGTAPRAARALPPTDEAVDQCVNRLVERLKACQQTQGPQKGSFAEEMSGVHAGGVTSLVTYALLAAGVPWHDPVIESAVRYLAEQPLPGTYSRGLRANVWSLMTSRVTEDAYRTRCRRMLQTDADWIASSLKPDGYHGYDHEGTGGDHSCSQFGVLGAWAAESAGGEISSDYWSRITKHWLSHQHADGSWSYNDAQEGTPTMTTAGANTMLVAMSQYLVRGETPYVRLRGVFSRGRLGDDQPKVWSASERAFAWLGQHNLLLGGPYQLFGLERLGVASGRKLIGTTDWYRSGVESIPDVAGSVVDDAFRLLFLTYGRAPVLIGKLQYGAGEEWNTYYRDLHFLTTYLSAQHERIYKWQIVSADAPLHDLLDAPLLLISGRDAPALSVAQRERLRQYVAAGGTIIGHADQASERFARDFRQLMLDTFCDRPWDWAPLPEDHGLYAALPSDERGKWRSDVRMEGLGDGLRTAVYLCPVDIAGAWHQNQTRAQGDLFRLMSNLRVCAAPDYAQLPRRLRPPELDGSPVPARGYLSVRLWALGGQTATLAALETLSARLDHEQGLSIVFSTAPVTAASDLKDVDLLLVSGPAGFDLPDEKVDWVADYVRQGGFVWLEGAGAKAPAVDALQPLARTLATKLSATKSAVADDHPILTGHVPGGEPCGEFRPNRWARNAKLGSKPPIETLSLGGETRVLLTPFDVLATGTNSHLFGVPGYGSTELWNVARNVMLWRYDSVSEDPRSVFVHDVVRKRSGAGIVNAVGAWIDGGQLEDASRGLLALDRLMPDEAKFKTMKDRFIANLRAMLTDNPRAVANAKARAVRLLALHGVAIEETPPTREAADSSRKGAPGTEPGEHEAARGRPGVVIPIELDAVLVQTPDGEVPASTLLYEWFDRDGQRADVVRRAKDVSARDKELSDRAAAIVNRQGARGQSGQRGGPELEDIAKQRKQLEEQSAGLRTELSRVDERLDKITAQLLTVRERLEAMGVRYDKRRWQVGPEPPAKSRP